MSSLLSRFVPQTDFDSYEDFRQNFRIVAPGNFNFPWDTADVYVKEDPEKIACVWCNDGSAVKTITFKELKGLSDKGANVFRTSGIKRGNTVRLILKSRCKPSEELKRGH